MLPYKISKKTNGIYIVSFYVGDKRCRLSTETRDPKIARERARELVNGTYVKPAVSTTFKSNSGMTMRELFHELMLDAWSPRKIRSQRTMKSNVKILNEMIGDEAVATINYSRLKKLVQELYDRGYADGTVHRKMCAISKALNEATRMEDDNGKPVLAAKVPIPTVVARNARSRVLTHEEEVAIFDQIGIRERAEPIRDWRRFAQLLRFLLDTGCRLGEALNVSDAILQEREGVTYVSFPRYTTKNEKPRTLPLTQAIVSAVPELRARANGGKFFPMKSQTVWYMWDTIRADLCSDGMNVQDVVLHTMRHTFLTRLAQSGKVSIYRISEWAGHSSIQVTMDHYLHLMPEDKLDTLDVIEGMALESGIRSAHPTNPLIAA